MPETAAAAMPRNQGKPKVTLCHKGKTLSVAQPAVPAHLRHGDTVGPCGAPPATAAGTLSGGALSCTATSCGTGCTCVALGGGTTDCAALDSCPPGNCTARVAGRAAPVSHRTPPIVAASRRASVPRETVWSGAADVEAACVSARNSRAAVSRRFGPAPATRRAVAGCAVATRSLDPVGTCCGSRERCCGRDCCMRGRPATFGS